MFVKRCIEIKAGVFAVPVTPRGAGRSGVPQAAGGGNVTSRCITAKNITVKGSPQTLQEINPANIFFQAYQLI